MKLLVNHENINRVYGCIKVRQGNIKLDIESLEKSKLDPNTWTQERVNRELAPLIEFSDEINMVESLLTNLVIKHGRDYHKSKISHREARQTRTMLLKQLGELAEPLGFNWKNKEDLGFKEIHEFYSRNVQPQKTNLHYKTTVEYKISYQEHELIILSQIEEKLIVGLILEESELNKIEFKS